MRFGLAGVVTLLSLSSTAALADSPFKVTVHAGVCNEIQTTPIQGPVWISGSMTGGHKPEMEFESLKRNQLDKVTMGQRNQITLEYQGPKIDGQSLPSGQTFSMDSSNLTNGHQIVGKALIAYDGQRSGMMTVPPIPQDKGFRQRIYFATLFAPKDMRKIMMVETCVYVPGDLPADFEGCVWVDQNSRPSNGLPYCW